MKWEIFGRGGSAKTDDEGQAVYAETLEYSGKWMGECFLTVTVKSAYPIDFAIGDYIDYRGERFTINYDPTVVKKARRGTYGEGFTYESVKFNAYSNELTEVMFHDVVLSDNEIHYTSLPNFSFYCKDVDDLADRLQANTDRWCKANGRGVDDYWLFYTLKNASAGTGNDRTVTRAEDVLSSAGVKTGDAAYTTYTDRVKTAWTAAYGTDEKYADSRDDERFDRNVTASSQTVWDMLGVVKQQFGLNFIIRGRNVYIGTAGVAAEHLFKYGKGNGLYEVDKTADQDQKVVTKLHAYGSNENLPTRYYATLNAKPYAGVTAIVEGTDDLTDGTTAIHFVVDTDLGYSVGLFTLTAGNGSYAVQVKVGDTSVWATAEEAGSETFTTRLTIDYSALAAGKNTNRDAVLTFCKAVSVGTKIYLERGVTKSAVPSANLDYSQSNLPNNMAINYLMLPGFPDASLADLCRSDYDEATDKTNYYIKTAKDATTENLLWTEDGKHLITFSTDALDPYLLSGNSEEVGVKEGDIFCNEENDDNGLEKVYPTLEETTDTEAGIAGATGARIDAIKAADEVEDNGVWPQDKKTSIPGFSVTLPKLGFDLEQAASDGGGELQISMKDGFCGGRTFEVASVAEQADGTWKLQCKRTQDSGTELYYPYSYKASINGTPSTAMAEAYQILAGDHYVLTGLSIDDANYVEAAARRLLKKAIHWLCKNDYTRYVYSPKIDEIYMARQHDTAQTDTTQKSLHDTLKEGDQLLFGDDDLKLSGAVYIDQLNIKENGNNGIPTYEVTLRNEVQVGTLERLQNTVDSIKTDVKNGAASGGVSTTDVDRLTRVYGAQYFLSKVSDDVAAGQITFEQAAALLSGLTWGENGAYALTAEGGAVLDDGRQTGYSLTTDDSLIGGKGFHFSKDADGRGTLWTDFLNVRVKAVYQALEVLRLSYVGGNRVIGPAGGRIMYVERLDADGAVLGDDTADGDVYTWRCYLYSDDGSESTQNNFAAGDQVRCQTLNITERTSHEAQNRAWWRVCVATGRGQIAAIKDRDEKEYEYIDLCGDRMVTTSDTALKDYAGSYGAMRGADGSACDYPQAEDQACTLGSWVSENRRNAIMLLTSDDTAPAIVQYKNLGVAGYHFVLDSSAMVTRLSPSGNLLTGDFRTTSGNSLEELIAQVQSNVTEISSQADRRLDIWFGAGAPHPQSATDTEAGAPASDWTTDEDKALHAGDLYYDTSRDPASDGGRAWKYAAHTADATTAYYWSEVTDADTVAALEKAAALQSQVDNLASDGVLSGGAEKSELLTRWTQAEADYNKEVERAADYALITEQTYLDLVNARNALATLLNGGETLADGGTPAWIATDALNADTTVDAESYRKAWADFYEALAAMRSLYLETQHKKYDAGIETTNQTAALWAKTFNDDGTVKEGSAVLAKPSGAGLVSYNTKTGKTASIGTYDGDKIVLNADQIELAANVEAHLLRSETQNIESNVHDFGTYGKAIIIDGSAQNIRVDSDCTFLLPCDGEFVGMRLLLVAYPPYLTGATGTDAEKSVRVTLSAGRVLVNHIYGSTNAAGTVDEALATIDGTATDNGNASGAGLKAVFTNNGCDRLLGGPRVGVENTSTSLTEYYTPNTLAFENGAIELLGLPVDVSAGSLVTVESTAAGLNAESGTVEYKDGVESDAGTWTKTADVTRLCRWAVINYHGEGEITGAFEAFTAAEH